MTGLVKFRQGYRGTSVSTARYVPLPDGRVV